MRRGTIPGIEVAWAVIIILLAPELQAQWQRVETLEGISVQDFAITSGGVMYVCSDREDGFYTSTDFGVSWQRRDDADSLLFLQFETFEDGVFGLTADYYTPQRTRRLFSLDAPNAPLAWIPSPRGGSVGSFCCTENGTLYASVMDTVYRSIDLGENWTAVCKVFQELPGKNALRIDERDRLWSQSESSLAWYDPASSSWISIGGGGAYYSSRRRVFVQENGDVFINGRTGIVRFDAVSQSFHDVYVPASPPRIGLEFWPAEDGRLFVAVGNDDYYQPSAWLYESTDGGQSWDTVGVDLQLPVSFLGEHEGVIFANHAGMLVRTRDHGRTFESRSRGIASKDVWKFGIRGNYLVAQSWRYAISTDAGVQWTTRGINPGGNPQGIQTSLDGTWLEDMGVFRISRDGGQTWERPWATDPEYTPSDFLVIDNLVILATVTGSIHRSTDNGWSWSKAYTTSPYVTNLIEVHGVLYGLSGVSLLRSTDRGASWQTSALPAADSPILTGNDRVLLLSASSVLWTSTDMGASWTPLPLDKLSQGIKTFAVSRQGMFAAVRDDSKPDTRRRDVIFSIDDGKSWHNITGDLPGAFTEKNFTPASDIAFTYSDKLYVNVRGRGLYVYDNIPVTVEAMNTQAESMHIDLWPTVASSEIQYRVNTQISVSVAIYNSIGAEMHRADMHSGDNATHVDVRGWPAGNYFLRASGADGYAFREFVVLR